MTEPRESAGQYPVNHVVGVIDTPAGARAAVEALTTGGFLASEVHVACGNDAAAVLQATTGRTGLPRPFSSASSSACMVRPA